VDKRWIQNSRYNNHYTGLYRPLGLQELEACIISTKSAYEYGKVVSPVHRPPLTPLLQEIPQVLICYKLSRSQGYSAEGRIESLKNLFDHNGNRTRDQVYGAVPQPAT
jgi:hypothetical protein